MELIIRHQSESKALLWQHREGGDTDMGTTWKEKGRYYEILVDCGLGLCPCGLWAGTVSLRGRETGGEPASKGSNRVEKVKAYCFLVLEGEFP